MHILVLGASGKTGKRLTEQLLGLNQQVKIIVRSPDRLPAAWKNNQQLTIIKGSIADMREDELVSYLEDCRAAASCLGHTISFKGILGKPRRLVTDAVRIVCNAVMLNKPSAPLRLVLMNTVATRYKEINEHASLAQKAIMALLRFLLPPAMDNEKAALYLRKTIGTEHPGIQWVAVRPDSLLEADQVTAYEIHPSPIRSPLFNPGKTSRNNVAHFMAALLTDDSLWEKWKGKMPVIYNK